MRTTSIFIVLGLALMGCATATPTQKGAVGGSMIGAGLGAIIGNQSGKAAEGALIGAAAGGLGGALVGDAMASQFCPTCGREYFADQTHCPMDGTPLRHKGAPPQTAEQQKTQTAMPYFCPACGYQGEKEGFCPNDGTKLKGKTS